MSDKVYRIAIVTLLSLILVIMGVNTFSQIRAQRKFAVVQNERIEKVKSQFEERQEQNSRRLQQGEQGNQKQGPGKPGQYNPKSLVPQLNPEMLENMKNLTGQNEQQGKLIRELFGKIDELQQQIDNLNEKLQTETETDQ